MPIFLSLKGRIVLIKSGGHRTRFCGRAACVESVHHMRFLRFLREDWGEFLKWHVCERGKKALKNPFFQNLHRDITLDALFHGGHHVMRNKRCAVQDQ